MALAKLSQWTHQSAATLVGDVERPRILQQPGSKRAVGRLVMLGIAMVAALSLMTWSGMQQPPERIKKHWLSVQPLEQQMRFMNESATKLSNGTMLCPCMNRPQQQLASYQFQRFFVFYLIAPNPKIKGAYIRDRDIQTDGQVHASTSYGESPFSFQLCSGLLPVQSPYVEPMDIFCESFAESIAGYLDLHKDDSSFLNPGLFLNHACGGLQDATFTATKVNRSKWNPTTEDKVLDFFTLMWSNMLLVCYEWNGWPPPKDDDYWYQIHTDNILDELVSGSGVNVSVNRSVAFAMDVNWTMYYDLCSPLYCDEFLQTSLGWNLFVGVAQVGGFLSIALVLLRALLWPTIQALIGWRSEPVRSLMILPENTKLRVSPEQPFHLLQEVRSSQNKHLTYSNSWS